VFRAVSVIAGDMGSVAWKLWNGATEADKREVLSGPWYDLLSDPSPEFDLPTIRALTRIWMLLDGDAFWVLRRRDGAPVDPRAIPGLIEPVRGTRMTELLAPTKILAGWEMELGEGRGKLRLRTDQVVHFRLPNPENPRRGLAPLAAVRRSIRTDSKAHLWNESSLDNNAEPGVVFGGVTFFL
jgi:phage portal protein BeeE